MEDFERGRMEGVAAEVAEKVGVFSRTTTETPARARRNPSIMPAGVSGLLPDELAARQAARIQRRVDVEVEACGVGQNLVREGCVNGKV